ncbi:helicase-related protein [Floridanema evergladense]|uniref:Helicase-related protein n=1 Tax=Floridaenema evergladense BLCC-F167 TaxID=3153639 RepID=A0ABV4WRV4_9CYAN
MAETIIGKRISIPGQFTGNVTVESAKLVDDTWLLKVRTQQGDVRDAYLAALEAEQILANQQPTTVPLVDGNQFFLFIESGRIKAAYEFDPHFAVSLSGVRPLPHQLEAVYERILPQVRLRFLLADDPGAGKTIMAGLLLKELKLRNAVERVLILAPAPLTMQWQDELRSKFSETFEVINSVLAKGQLAGNPWERFRQCIASIDFAKRDDIVSGIMQVDWDLVIIDEAHKCSARTQGDELRRTGRYKLAEELSRISERILLLTATPHQGDVDQFHNFLRLLDPEQFISNKLNPEMLKLEDSPWFLRRIKEELRDFEGRKLFKDRIPKTIPFELSSAEKYLYDQVTKYINKYLGKTKGRKQAAVALARTVLQRRLASSLNAIFSSLKKRQRRFADLWEELKKLPPSEQRERLLNLGKPVDTEKESDDCEEEELENLASESTLAEQLDQLREELGELERLVKLAQQTIEIGSETKLNALKDCLSEAEFNELKDGRGKLLIFTEHRDTLEYLKKNLNAWGYSTCEIHGGMNVLARKSAQLDFKLHKQICLATEAAGEGINLQFCRLMINYDLPWNPNRLEQRMGRIHRIGQENDVYIFNFVAINTVEGRVLDKLLSKLEEIRKALNSDRVFDVIGQLLHLNDIRFEDMIREATYAKAAEDEVLDQIERLNPKRLEELEQATGVALATSHVDLSRVRCTQKQDYISEEQRLMPRYVEEFFKRSCDYLRINLETRADGLWRIPYLKEEFRSGNLDAARRLGTPEKNYPKLTFYKEHLSKDVHQDAELLSPGHPLFAAIAERLDNQLDEQIRTGAAVFIDADADTPYSIHFFNVQVAGQQRQGKDAVLRASLCAIKQKISGEFTFISTDCLHDLAPAESGTDLTINPPTPVEQQDIEDWLKVKVQFPMINQERSKRERELQIRQNYLKQAMDSAIREAQTTQMKLAAKVAAGDETYRVARDNAQKKVKDLQERYKTKQTELDYLKIIRPGRVAYLGTALVFPAPVQTLDNTPLAEMRNDPEVEALAMQYVMDYEQQRGWQPIDVSKDNDGCGFDIRSIGPEKPETGKSPVRRIEVKGRAQLQQQVSLTVNEWRKAQQLGDSYWLYVVWGCKTSNPQLLMIQNPAKVLAGDAKEIRQVTRYLVSADALERSSINND